MTDAMVAREQIARSIRLLRPYQHDLRREAKNLAAQVYTERPRQFVNRVRRLWRSAKDAAPHADSKPVWLRAGLRLTQLLRPHWRLLLVAFYVC